MMMMRGSSMWKGEEHDTVEFRARRHVTVWCTRTTGPLAACPKESLLIFLTPVSGIWCSTLILLYAQSLPRNLDRPVTPDQHLGVLDDQP